MTFLKYAVFFFLLAIGNIAFAQIISSESSSSTEPIDWAKPKEYTIAIIEVEATETDKNLPLPLMVTVFVEEVPVIAPKLICELSVLSVNTLQQNKILLFNNAWN